MVKILFYLNKSNVFFLENKPNVFSY